jgi:hypothetical protein
MFIHDIHVFYVRRLLMTMTPVIDIGSSRLSDNEIDLMMIIHMLTYLLSKQNVTEISTFVQGL